MNLNPPSRYDESLEAAVGEDAWRLDLRADELSALKPDRTCRSPLPERFPNAERVAQLRGWANHLRAMSAVRMRAKYQA